jgi:hypothetical protein
MGGPVGTDPYAPTEQMQKLNVAKTIVKFYNNTQLDYNADRVALLSFDGDTSSNQSFTNYDLGLYDAATFNTALGGISFQ